MKGVLGCGVKVSISDFESDGDGALPSDPANRIHG